MQTSLSYFLLIVKEQSIARAAEKLFITPQNLSNHVRRLEKQYGVLFRRSPRFELTPAGAALADMARGMQILEESFKSRLEELQGQGQRRIRMGIHPTRARVLLPRVLPEFLKDFPKVTFDFISNNVAAYETMLRDGELDLFFGFDVHIAPDFTATELLDEQAYLVLSDAMLGRSRLRPKGSMMGWDVIARLPFFLSPPSSRFRPKLEEFCGTRGVKLRELAVISDFETQLILTSQGTGACFCPQMMLSKLKEMNLRLLPSQRLHAFRVEELGPFGKLTLITHALSAPSRALEHFTELIQKEFQKGF